jgi:hypothetical protein
MEEKRGDMYAAANHLMQDLMSDILIRIVGMLEEISLSRCSTMGW